MATAVQNGEHFRMVIQSPVIHHVRKSAKPSSTHVFESFGVEFGTQLYSAEEFVHRFNELFPETSAPRLYQSRASSKSAWASGRTTSGSISDSHEGASELVPME
jgi:hypothetical protein